VHISKIGKIKGADNEIKPGTQLAVIVQEFDREKRRIALGLAETGAADKEDDAQAEALHKKYVRSETDGKNTGSLGTLGDALRHQMEQKKKK
jgi:ribosomal protein S1